MNSTLSLSLEMVCLMHWMLKHEKRALLEILSRAAERGIQLDILLLRELSEPYLYSAMSETVSDFFSYLESNLSQQLSEGKDIPGKEGTKEKISALVKKVDLSQVDSKVVLEAARKTQKKMNQKKNSEDAETVFDSALLKNWKIKQDTQIN